MTVSLKKATIRDKKTIQNLGRFYVYEMARYCGWKTPSNGLFSCRPLDAYCKDKKQHAFLIRVDRELAGFAIVNKTGSSPDVDWNVKEFFIVSKFQKKGVGRFIAESLFQQFQGIWETSQIPENEAAIKFWRKVVDQYTKGNFEEDRKIVPNPKPHPMIIQKFTSP